MTAIAPMKNKGYVGIIAVCVPIFAATVLNFLLRMYCVWRTTMASMEQLASELEERDCQITALQERALQAEQTRHEFIEEMRYVIEAGSFQVQRDDPLRSEHLKMVGHVLPYLLSKRRHWGDLDMPEFAESVQTKAKQLAAEYGFALPDDPVHAVKSMLDLAFVLFNPAMSFPLEGLRNRYPVQYALVPEEVTKQTHKSIDMQ